MALAFLTDENIAAGLSKNAAFKIGISNTDDGAPLEQGLAFPWVVDPAASFLAYNPWIECHLDAGIVLHKPLPQSAQGIDSLGIMDVFDTRLASNIGGVNLKSAGTYADVVQRMATSDYRFVLKGYALRIGYQIPVPKLVSVCGLPAYPDQIQWSLGNPLVGNYGGIPLYFNRWELWYFVATPPRQQQLPAPNIGQSIRADDPLPKGMQVPWSQSDQQAQPTSPLQRVLIPS